MLAGERVKDGFRPGAAGGDWFGKLEDNTTAECTTAPVATADGGTIDVACRIENNRERTRSPVRSLKGVKDTEMVASGGGNKAEDRAAPVEAIGVASTCRSSAKDAAGTGDKKTAEGTGTVSATGKRVD